jgi:hypothetical protein
MAAGAAAGDEGDRPRLNLSAIKSFFRCVSPAEIWGSCEVVSAKRSWCLTTPAIPPTGQAQASSPSRANFASVSARASYAQLSRAVK